MVGNGVESMTDVNDVISYAEHLIASYKRTYDNHVKQGNFNMANSVKGSIIGVVALLSYMTDKAAEDYFREIFPEDWEVKK